MVLYDYNKVAELLGCSRNKIKTFVSEGHLNAVSLPGQKRKKVAQSELNKFIQSLNKGNISDPAKKENPVLKYKKSNSARHKVA